MIPVVPTAEPAARAQTEPKRNQPGSIHTMLQHPLIENASERDRVFVELQGVGKTYSRRSWFKRVLGRMARDSDLEDEDDYDEPEEEEGASSPFDRQVLRDIDLRIDSGEVVGVIGRTASGKTTLLNIICNVTPPTNGTVTGKGRIVPLATFRRPMDGLNTGRRNLEIFGRMNGFLKSEIQDAIERAVEDSDFSGKIDERITRYASTEFMQLGYNFALHLKPDILVVDGALAVGDAHNQQEFLDRLLSFPNPDRILILCTSKFSTLRDFCSRAIWLQDGIIAGDGEPGKVIETYLGNAKSTRVPGTDLPEVYRRGPKWFLESGFALHLGHVQNQGKAILSALQSPAVTDADGPVTPTADRPNVAPDAWDEVARFAAEPDAGSLLSGIAALRAEERSRGFDFAPLNVPMGVWGTLESFRLLTRDGTPTQVAVPGESLMVETTFRVDRPDTRMDMVLALSASESIAGLLDKGPTAFATAPLLSSRIPRETIFERPGLYRVRVDLPGRLSEQIVDDVVLDCVLTFVLRNAAAGYGGVNRGDLSLSQIADILRRLEGGEALADIVPTADEPPEDPTERMLRDQLLRNLPALPKAIETVSLSLLLKGSLNEAVATGSYGSAIGRASIVMRPGLGMVVERARDERAKDTTRMSGRAP